MKTVTFNPLEFKLVPIELLNAVEHLLKCKGRFHTEQNFNALKSAHFNYSTAPEYPADDGWTLCSDGLPKDDEQVLICTDSGQISAGSFNSQSYDGCWSIGNSSMVWDHDFNLGVTVEKWMPQPVPEAS